MAATFSGSTGASSLVQAPAISERQRELTLAISSFDPDSEIWVQANQFVREIERTSSQSLSFRRVQANDHLRALSEGGVDAYFGRVDDNAALHPAFTVLGIIPQSAASHGISTDDYLHGDWELALSGVCEQSSVKVLISGRADQNLGLWSKTPIRSLASIAQTKILARGLAAGVVARLGASEVTDSTGPAADITSDAIFAADGGSASQCLNSGLARAARFCTKQAIVEGAPLHGLTISNRAWLSLGSNNRRLFQTIARKHLNRMASAMTTSSHAFQSAFHGVHGTVFYDLNPDFKMAVQNARKSIFEELATGDALSLRATTHFLEFDTHKHVA